MRMERGIIRPQICQDNDLSQDIREALFSAHDHTCIRDDRIYMMIGQTVFCLANDEAGKALRYAVTNRQKIISRIRHLSEKQASARIRRAASQFSEH